MAAAYALISILAAIGALLLWPVLGGWSVALAWPVALLVCLAAAARASLLRPRRDRDGLAAPVDAPSNPL